MGSGSVVFGPSTQTSLTNAHKGVSADDDLSIPHVSNEDISVEEGEVGDIGMIELP